MPPVTVQEHVINVNRIWCDTGFPVGFISPILHKRGLGSSVGIATDYGLDSMWIESQWGQDFLPVQIGPVANPASYTMGTRSFPGGKVWLGHAADHSPHSSAEVLEK
jgi:hypothetical protein